MNKINNKIILIEGCDCSGKTTLLNKLIEKYGNCVYIHNAVTNDIKSLHINTIETAILAQQQHYVLIDRLHISELVYGTIYRNGPSYDIDKFEHENIDTLPNIIKIMCLPSKETVLSKWCERKSNGGEMFTNKMEKVWDMYKEYYDKHSDSWKLYNWEHNTIDLNTFEIGIK